MLSAYRSGYNHTIVGEVDQVDLQGASYSSKPEPAAHQSSYSTQVALQAGGTGTSLLSSKAGDS